MLGCLLYVKCLCIASYLNLVVEIWITLVMSCTKDTMHKDKQTKTKMHPVREIYISNL